jgi:plasmid maintenance system antidote protein VapI
MDPLTALSLAGTIVQFVQFATQIVQATVSGPLPVHEELETRTLALRDFIARLRRPRDPENAPTSLPSPVEAFDKTLQDLCDGCAVVADELLTRLNRLKVEGKHNMWKNLQNAIKSAWSQNELESLGRRLSEFQTALDTHVLAKLKYEIPRIQMHPHQDSD